MRPAACRLLLPYSGATILAAWCTIKCTEPSIQHDIEVEHPSCIFMDFQVVVALTLPLIGNLYYGCRFLFAPSSFARPLTIHQNAATYRSMSMLFRYEMKCFECSQLHNFIQISGTIEFKFLHPKVPWLRKMAEEAASPRYIL